MSTVYEQLCEGRDKVLPCVKDRYKKEEYQSLLYRLLQIAFFNEDEFPREFTILNGLRLDDFKKAVKDFGFDWNVELLGNGSGKNVYRIKLN